jgi:hypothetical protein
MKSVSHISPSGLARWLGSEEEYYTQYLSDDRPDREPQNSPMAIGSAFDAYCKSYLHEKLFGVGNDPKYALDAIFEAQVEPQCRDLAKRNGKYVFEQYQSSGALSDLMLDLSKANGTPRFEFEVSGAINGYREGRQEEMGEVIILGKPDVSYVNQNGKHIILDWKVNGYYSQYPPSPMKGYIRMRSAGKTNHGMHKEANVMMVDGVMINVTHYLETLNEEWATQLASYCWLCGDAVGSHLTVQIHQIVCNAQKSILPSIRVAEHSLRISPNYQLKVFNQYCELWDRVHSDHYFRSMTKQESQLRCQMLDGMANAIRGDGSPKDEWFRTATRNTDPY